jgi:hypothetical protein
MAAHERFAALAPGAQDRLGGARLLVIALWLLGQRFEQVECASTSRWNSSVTFGRVAPHDATASVATCIVFSPGRVLAGLAARL